MLSRTTNMEKTDTEQKSIKKSVLVKKQLSFYFKGKLKKSMACDLFTFQARDQDIKILFN
jgi:hypothetical protein